MTGKRPLKMIPALAVLLLALSGCAGSKEGSADEKLMETVLQSYYDAQSSRACGMLQKNIFKGQLEGWTERRIGDIQNPVWNYDSFTQYQIFDQDMSALPDNQELYYCTFSADGNKYGYAVILSEGDGLGLIEVKETPYLFDLQENLDDVRGKLSGTGIDLTSAMAFRVRIPDTEEEEPEEAVLITDGSGNSCVYCFTHSAIHMQEV